MRRINVSLDTLNQDLFRKITRGGDLKEVLRGIDIARTSGLAVKINTVALKDTNEWEIEALIRWAHAQGMDITLIETMPLGDTGEDRTDQYLPLSVVRARLAQRLTMQNLTVNSGGPARYVSIAETGGKLGFITPMTHNFCEGCNRVRVTCEGMLYLCLGQEDAVDLRAPLRSSLDDGLLHEAIDQGMRIKPRGHDFQIGRGAQPSLSRHMSLTGG